MNAIKCVIGCAVLLCSLAVIEPPFSQAAVSLSQINVYPNPVRTYLGQSTVTFGNITEQAQIKIYNTYGLLVRSINLLSSGGQYQWNLLNDSNEMVASGVYMYRITNNIGENITGKVAIIR